jgi:hypothetical protein
MLILLYVQAEQKFHNECRKKMDLLVSRNKTKWKEPQTNKGKQCADMIKAV